MQIASRPERSRGRSTPEGASSAPLMCSAPPPAAGAARCHLNVRFGPGADIGLAFAFGQKRTLAASR